MKRGCFCLLCAMRRLFHLIPTLVNKVKEIRPESWNINEKVDEDWFCEFLMRHTEELLGNFNIKCDNSPTFHTEQILEPNISDNPLQEKENKKEKEDEDRYLSRKRTTCKNRKKDTATYKAHHHRHWASLRQTGNKETRCWEVKVKEKRTRQEEATS